jgi:predicted unusual protein kinase regulating ubiquinone biosynthesis (AarF/ABC1/UbiB family)
VAELARGTETKKVLLKNKAVLSILVREVQDLLADRSVKTARGLARRINAELDSWVTANRLHPERPRGPLLSKLVHEIQSCLSDAHSKSAEALTRNVSEVLNSWSLKHELRPELCERMSIREFRRWLRNIELEDLELQSAIVEVDKHAIEQALQIDSPLSGR